FPGQLGQSTRHRRATDAVHVAQLVLRRQAVVGAVVAECDLVEQQPLQLRVDRYRTVGIDRQCAGVPGQRQSRGKATAKPGPIWTVSLMPSADFNVRRYELDVL